MKEMKKWKMVVKGISREDFPKNYLGDYHYWALLTLSRDHYFRYRECSGRRRSLEVALRRKPTCGFDIYFVKHVLKF